MASTAGNIRFLKSAITLTPKEIKQLAGLMALRKHGSIDSQKEQKSEQQRLELEDLELQKAIHQHFQTSAVPVESIPERSSKSPEEFWNEIQYRARLMQEHKKNEAARLAAIEAEGRTARRYYKRGKGTPLKWMMLGSVLLGLSYGLYEHSMRAKFVSQTFLYGESAFSQSACHLAIGQDGPVHVVDHIESLTSQKVYRVFASCDKPGFLHIQNQQSLPATTLLNIPIQARQSWEILNAQGKPLAIYVSGTQSLRVRYAFSEQELKATDTLEAVAGQTQASWLREYLIPIMGE